MSKTYTEAAAQFSMMKETLAFLRSREREWLNFYQRCDPSSLCFMACGSSYCICNSAERVARMLLHKPSWSVTGGDMFLNESYLPLLANALMIAPSRSGSTSEAVAAARRAKEAGAALAVITLNENTPLSELADYRIEMPWANNHVICQTSCVQNLYLANLILMLQLSGDKGVMPQIEAMIEKGGAFIAANEEAIRAVARRDWNYAVLLADERAYGLALEGAMAFAEIANIKAHAYHVLDMRHGPIVLLDDKTLVLMLSAPEGLAHRQNLIDDMKKRGATVVTFSAEPLPIRADLCVSFGAAMDLEVAAMPMLFVAQALSCFKSEAAGRDPDEPNDLPPWIELTI